MAPNNTGNAALLPDWVPWKSLYSWSPFSIDALGLVTLLGAEEMNAALGRLVPSRYLEYMPLLGAFVIAGDRFKEKTPGYHLYNLTVGVTTTDMASWFTRWMAAQDFELTRSYVTWNIIPKSKARKMLPLLWPSILLSLCLVGFLIALTIMSYDWYGFANAIALILSILSRSWIMKANRDAIDDAVEEAIAKEKAIAKDKEARASKEGRDEPKMNHFNIPYDEDIMDKVKLSKIMIVLSDSKAVTMMIPNFLMIEVFIKDARPKWGRLYQFARWIGWIAFAVQVVSIGMAKLASQIYTVALMVIPTILVNWKLGCDDSKWYVKFKKFIEQELPSPAYDCWIGTRLKATVTEWDIGNEFVYDQDNDLWTKHDPHGLPLQKPRSDKRQHLYAWLNMEEPEEESWAKWDLFPHQREKDQDWWRTYLNMKALIQGYGPIVAKEQAAEWVKGGRHRQYGYRREVSNALPLSKDEDRNTHLTVTELSQTTESSAASQNEQPEPPPQGIQRSGTALSNSGNIRGIPIEALTPRYGYTKADDSGSQ